MRLLLTIETIQKHLNCVTLQEYPEATLLTAKEVIEKWPRNYSDLYKITMTLQQYPQAAFYEYKDCKGARFGEKDYEYVSFNFGE